MKKKVLSVVIFLALIGLVAWGIKVGGFLKKNNSQNSNVNEKYKLEIVMPMGLEEVNFVFDFISDNGFFEKNNLDVKKIPIVKNSFQAFATGQGDAYIAGSSSPIAAYFNNDEPRIIADILRVSNVFAISRYDHKDMGLVKRVGVTTVGSEVYLTARLFLKSVGIDPDSVEYVILPEDSARAIALEKGHVDFAVISSQQVITKMNAKEKYTVLDPSVLQDDMRLDKYLTTRQETIDEKSNELGLLVKALHEGLLFMDDNPEKVISYVKEKKSFNEQQAVEYQTAINAARTRLNLVPDIKALDVTAKAAKEELKLDNYRDLSEIIYADFAKKVIE